MIQNNDSNNKIKENKYKILRMSLLLGNDDDREDTISNFEDAAREIDTMNDEVYLKDLEGKFYDTLTLEEEEKKLSVLVDYIGGRVDQRISLLEDFSNVTGYELLNLPPIKYQEKLDEYKNRLFYIREYLDNNKNIEKLNKEIDELDNELNNAYVSKAKDENRNKLFEDELANKYNNIVRSRKEFLDINLENAEIKLSDIKQVVEDSKKSLDIFNKSFETLNQAGISGEERNEYLSYVNNAKVAYYDNKELEYLVKLYTIVNKKEAEYNKILAKRDSINDIVYERSSLRKELNITTEDILMGIYNVLEKQYDDISNQKENMDNIEYLNVEIANRKDLVTDLIKDNQKVEILALLKEFCLIDSYEEENEDKKDETETIEDKEEVKDAELEINTDDIKEEDSIAEDEVADIPVDDVFDNNKVEDEIPTDISEPVVDEIPPFEANVEEVEEEKPSAEVEVKDNQIIDIVDAGSIDVEKAIAKSNNVMRRVGDMLGVKIEKVAEDKNTQEQPQEEVEEEKKKEEVSGDEKAAVAAEIPEATVETPEVATENNEATVETPEVAAESKEQATEDNKESEFDFNENIFMNDNFDADPETANNVEANNTNNEETENTSAPVENPLFNNDLANKTIDDVMADAKVNDTDDNNDFWFSQEDTPVDLNSLPDIGTDEASNNTFFGDSNDSPSSIPNLDFPSLDVPGEEKKEEVSE